MGVSLEQVRILSREHGLKEEYFKSALDTIRKEGLGLTRCFKNIGKYCYAFNSMQLATFPREYVPPSECCGATAS